MRSQTIAAEPATTARPVPRSHVTGQLIGSWLGLATFFLFFLSFWPLSGFLPPLRPSMTADEVARYFTDHANGVRLSMIFMVAAGAMFCILIATICSQVRRIVDLNPMLYTLLVITGTVGSVIIITGGMVMTAVAFRPERPAGITYIMYDLAWLLIIMPAGSYVIMACALGAAILSDKAQRPVFPRWLGYFNIWVGLTFAPGLLVTFFKSGPLAWNGVFGFWVPAAGFGAWFLVMFVMLRAAIRQQPVISEHEPSVPPARASDEPPATPAVPALVQIPTAASTPTALKASVPAPVTPVASPLQSTADADIVAQATAEWRSYIEPLLAVGPNMVARMADPTDIQLRHELYRLVTSGFSMAYIGMFLGNTEYPDFWPILNMAYNWGNPNPDDAYYATGIEGDGVYRISGTRGTVRIIDFQIGGGEFYRSGGEPGPAFANYDIDDLVIDADGSFEVMLSNHRPRDHSGNWWHLDPSATYLLVRQRSYDWSAEIDGQLSIERVDRPAIRPRDSADTIAANLSRIAVWGETWTAFVMSMVERYRAKGLINRLEIADLGGEGGIMGGQQVYLQGVFEIEDDEVLLYETELPQKCLYWNVTVNDPNWSAIDYMNRQSSINGHAARIDSDGRFRAVLSATDPGVENWLDTAGYSTGVIFARWLDADSHPLPTLTKVRLADLGQYLPSDTAVVTAEERDAALRARRMAAQRRRRW